MSKSKDMDIESVYSYHAQVLGTTADYVRRIIHLYGDIDDAASYRFSVALGIMDREDGDITIQLSSTGGSVEDGFAIYDAIRLARNRVVIVGFGPIMSMAAVIMQAAELRLMAPNARFMIHDGHVGVETTALKFASAAREMSRCLERMVEILAERSGLTSQKILRLLNEETYLSAAEALESGFVDGIAMSNKEGAAEEEDERKLRAKKRPKKAARR
jgi:ATP-dependent Clp endopeptidase proteolytic subunit ClpP